jgi:uncharacterized membrane protein YwzB
VLFRTGGGKEAKDLENLLMAIVQIAFGSTVSEITVFYIERTIEN